MQIATPVYMVRGGEFGVDFGPKLWISVIAMALVAWDVVRRRRADYVYVFLLGAVTWTAVEFVLQASGMRRMPDRQLFGLPLPLPLSALIQGTAEGAAIAVLAIFVGDRVVDRNGRLLTALCFLLSCLFVATHTLWDSPFAAADPPVTSRRNMVAFPALLFLAALILVDAVFWVRCVRLRPRAIAMLSVLLLFGTAWTLGQISAGTRWIELPGATVGSFERASRGVSTMAFGFDIVVEIGLAYLPFFALPAMLGWLPEEAYYEAGSPGGGRSGGQIGFPSPRVDC